VRPIELEFADRVTVARPRITAVVERIVGTDAEDVVQEAVLRAYLSLSQLRDPARFEAWLCCIAINTAKMALRRRAVEVRALAAPNGNVLLDGRSEAGDEREVLDLVRDAVDLLPRGQRDAVLLHYVDGLSCNEIAALLGSSPGAVRVRLHRARAQLRRELAPLAPVPTPNEEEPMLEMKVEDVLVRVSAEDPPQLTWHGRIVVLKETNGERSLPIWTGAAEGDALAVRLRDASLPRPMSHDLMAELIRVMGAHVERTAITSLRDDTFYATVAVAVDGHTEELDARPSDALALAVRTGAPILVAEDVLEQAGVPAEGLLEKCESSPGDDADAPPPGEWRSLSAELFRSLHPTPRRRA
jgi:RNA polymerase sigma factor (sigma-70 family)